MSGLFHLDDKWERFREKAAQWVRCLIPREAGRGDGVPSPSLGMVLILPLVGTQKLGSAASYGWWVSSGIWNSSSPEL